MKAFHLRGTRGVALVVVLFFLVLVSAIVIGFLASVTTDLTHSKTAANHSTTNQLADSAVNLVMAQIVDATRSKNSAWASQPGMIRTFSSTGAASNFYKLYSSDQMVVAGENFDMATEAPDASWSAANNAGLYYDLNAPVLVVDRQGSITPDPAKPGEKFSAVYPILDPLAEGVVDGFSLSGRPGYISSDLPTAEYDPTSRAPAGQTANPGPMPVKWLYLLRDGSIRSAAYDSPGVVSVAGATSANPITGRIAFWTDDETCKVNINTASEGTYWDVPRAYTAEDFGKWKPGGSGEVGTPGLALCQPAQKEFQRYPGHPATTCLSPIFRNLGLPLSDPPTAGELAAYYAIAPRVVAGGSEGGTVIPGAPLVPDSDRLYASTDELMFTPRLAGISRVPNTTDGVAPDANQGNVLKKSALEKTRFFVTATSSAPETTLYNTPRIAVWPVNVTPGMRTAYDNLTAFCSTINGQNYLFTRGNARSNTADCAGRNVQLYNYLQALTSQDVPGFGGKFSEKYPSPGNGAPSDRDQILTSIFDYIRCTNLQDRSLGATPFTPLFNSISPALGAGEVLPIRINNTQGFGRFYSVSSANLLFYGTRGAGTSNRPDRMRAVFLLQFASPMQGLGAMRCNLKYTVTGLDKLQAKVGARPFNSLHFKPAGTNYMDVSDLSTHHGRSIGGTEGLLQQVRGKPFAAADAGGDAHNKYPFFSALDFDVPADPAGTPEAAKTTTFQFASTGEVQVEIRSADTDLLIQTLHFKFPDGQFLLPKMAGVAPAFDTTYDFASRVTNDPTGLVTTNDTMISIQVGGANLTDNATKPEAGTDLTAGDVRLTEALPDVPSDRFRAHNNYKTAGTQFAHGTLTSVGMPHVGAVSGKLTAVSSYQQTTPANFFRQPDVPSRVTTRAQRKDGGPGDWDTGYGDQKDGAHVNKPDEGDTAMTDAYATPPVQRLPYFFGNYLGFASSTNVYFSPNRQIPSPLMFGSLPTGIQRSLPWQTLLFHPRPEDTTHPGKDSPRDHLLADLFWMPVVEPYAISQPFSTSGKINLNYQIAPFPYIKRATGLWAAMKATKFMALRTADSTKYKPLDAGNVGFTLSGTRRYAIDAATTLAEFDKKFLNNEVFKSASEICEMNLIPTGESNTSMATFWNGNKLTGDNLREKPYVDLYPRLTTKSNTYTVHFCVQTLKQTPRAAANPGVFIDPSRAVVGPTDSVLSEYRGSATIERYIDPNDPNLPDFATLMKSRPTDPKLNIDQYYKFRVVGSKRFAP